MKNINLTKTLRGYTRGWVALSSDYKKVLFSGRSFVEVMRKVQENNLIDKVVLLKAVKNDNHQLKQVVSALA